MAWIQVIPKEEASGELAEYYRQVEEEKRRVSNVQKAISLNPKALSALDALQRSFEEDGVLSVRHRELVAVVTSALNRCYY